MKVKDLLHILSKDEAQKALADISLIDTSISTEPTEEYIQTFIDKFIKNTYLGYNSSHFIISNKQSLNSKFMTQVDLEQKAEAGFWVYRNNVGNSDFEPTVNHEFIYFGCEPNSYQEAQKQLLEYQKSRLYNWIALIDTSSEKVTMWVRQGTTGTWKKQRCIGEET